ncbi:hypothetical protein CLF_109701 [Clonorchis sinensis]|uniref:Uncharacterized protein n=1 Tax=Clonorchis sinensis TaxID=79923 RepID=G7YJN9_CLOSI|nr:hypothetical protein CLF_109701 [Clonorchis sinensis]
MVHYREDLNHNMIKHITRCLRTMEQSDFRVKKRHHKREIQLAFRRRISREYFDQSLRCVFGNYCGRKIRNFQRGIQTLRLSMKTTKEYTKLPPLSLSKADYFCRTTFPNQSTVKRVRKRILQADAQTETVCVPQFRCLVCGLDCQRGDILYAHLLLLRHEFDSHSIGGASPSSERSGRLSCRRCGRRWESEVEFLCSNQHSCIQQKAAYLSGFLAPSDSIRQGLPFVCLFCCTEPQEKGARRSYPIRTQTGLVHKRPLKPHEAAMRFTSKIHLVVHILCRHAVRRKNGMCAECPLVKLESPTDEDGPEECAFWCLRNHERKPKLPRILSADSDISSSDSDAETISAVHRVDYSMLRREGLQSIEKHIDQYHLPMFELITWYMQHSLSPQFMSSNTQRTAMYSCPICDLNNLRLLSKLSSISGEDYSSTFGECNPINGNAMLQAHLVCYHAGAKELDALLEVCQVCETSELLRIFRGTRSECSIEHDQGKRYVTHLGSPMANLVAQSRLQTHLLVQHCAQFGEGRSRCCQELDILRLRPCGWCGATANSWEESEAKLVQPDGYRLNTDEQSSSRKLRVTYRSYAFTMKNSLRKIICFESSAGIPTKLELGVLHLRVN